jgi:hypothetical protein
MDLELRVEEQNPVTEHYTAVGFGSVNKMNREDDKRT